MCDQALNWKVLVVDFFSRKTKRAKFAEYTCEYFLQKENPEVNSASHLNDITNYFTNIFPKSSKKK